VRLSGSGEFSSRSVAIEFAGNLKSAISTWWKPNSFGRDSLTSAQVAVGRILLPEGVRFAFAISRATRTAEMTRARRAGRAWATETLKVSDGGLGYRMDGGQVIPEVWRSFQV